MLCCEHDNIRPDMILLGKALSGGGERMSFVHISRKLMWHLRQSIRYPQCWQIRRLCIASVRESTGARMAGRFRELTSNSHFLAPLLI